MEKHTPNKSCATGSCSTNSCFSCKKVIPWMILLVLVITAGVAYSQYSKENIEMQKSGIVESPKMMSNQTNPSSMMEGNHQSQWTKEEMESMEKDSMMKNDSVMKTDEQSKMIMQKDTGYQMYSEALVDSALKDGQKVAIFFYASWCPNCRALDEAIKSNLSQIPSNTIIVQANYDTETALKQKYGVTVQTTVITLKSDGSLDQKMIGPKTIADILK